MGLKQITGTTMQIQCHTLTKLPEKQRNANRSSPCNWGKIKKHNATTTYRAPAPIIKGSSKIQTSKSNSYCHASTKQDQSQITNIYDEHRQKHLVKK